MAAGQGNKIEFQDYNNIYNIIAPVLGRNYGGTASVGYDNSPSASTVAQYAKISALQWSNLRSDISRCRGHQTGVDLLTNTTTVNGQTPLSLPNPSAQFTATCSGTTLVVSAVASGTIQIGSVLSGGSISGTYTITGFISGTNGGIANYQVTPALSIATASTVVSTYYIKITENDRSLYQTMAQAAYDNRIISPPSSIPAARKTTANLIPGGDKTNTGGWSGTIRQTITISFPQEASATNPADGAHSTARAYFNSGSQILFSASFAKNNSESKNVSWETLCSNLGTIRFGYNSLSITGGAGSSTATTYSTYSGYTLLPASGAGPSSTELLFKLVINAGSAGTIGQYNPNSIKLYGKKVNSGGFDILTFVFEFNDDAGSTTPFGRTPAPTDTPVDEPVNGTMTTSIQAEYAYSTTGYITVTPPTGASGTLA
jgi:hypothetical protein